MAPVPCVLLLEDEALIRRFVALALEGLPVALEEAHTLAQARSALDREGLEPHALLITDLMLPDGSGLDLLRDLRSGRLRRPPRRVAAFSAGLTAERVQELEALGVNRWLPKPVSVQALALCVTDALEALRRDPDSSFGSLPGRAAPLPDADREAVEQFFAGDRGLFENFREGVLHRLPRDAEEGERACADGDIATLRRLAHSLGSVLRLIGQPSLSDRARLLEEQARTGDPAALHAWAPLAAALRGLAGPAEPDDAPPAPAD